MNTDNYNQQEVSNTAVITQFITSLPSKDKEMILTADGRVVGAVLTAEQYEWFLDQLDARQDTSFIGQRINDTQEAQSLDDYKKEMKYEAFG
jgi:hypothetical protein